jgi:hypothetical protein
MYILEYGPPFNNKINVNKFFDNLLQFHRTRVPGNICNYTDSNREYLKLLPTSKAEPYRTDNYIQETYAPEYR